MKVAPSQVPVPNQDNNAIRSASLANSHEAAITANIHSLLETPEAMLRRVLLPDERVRAEFDCYFPLDYMPRWKLAMCLVMTCGLYAIVLCYQAIQRFCQRNFKLCTPNLVQIEKGKVNQCIIMLLVVLIMDLIIFRWQ